MRRPNVDDELTLLTDSGETTAICAEVSDDPTHAGGTLLKVMARSPCEEGQPCWIVEPDGSTMSATVPRVPKVRGRLDGVVVTAGSPFGSIHVDRAAAGADSVYGAVVFYEMSGDLFYDSCQYDALGTSATDIVGSRNGARMHHCFCFLHG